MCGFFLLQSTSLSRQSQLEIVDNSLSRLVHRGPDNQSTFRKDDFVFGHVRLSIQDLSVDANQPFLSTCGRYVLCFNGEIYNSPQLRKHLIDLGVIFRTINSDTEVLLHWLIQYGTSRFHDLDGEWAFTFYDSLDRSLILCRDRVGTKPLYYFQDDSNFLASSEFTPIALSGLCDIDISSIGLESYLVHGATASPHTLINNIFKVGAGQYVSLTPKTFTTYTWWSYSLSHRDSFQPSCISSIDCNRLVEDSVMSRTLSDVPFGVLFSGGVDSSIIANTISKNIPGSCHTFTIGYDPKPSFDEAKKAKFFSNVFNTQHHEHILSSPSVMSEIENLIKQYDIPLSDWVNLPLYFISKQAKKDGFSVLIGGEGADELFLGYPAYFRYIFQDFLLKFFRTPYSFFRITKLYLIFSKFFPALNYRISSLFKTYLSYGSSFISNSLVFAPFELVNSSKYLISNFTSYSSNLSTYQRIKQVEFTIRLPELLLMRVDSMTMLNSVEARVPFLSGPLLDSILELKPFILAPFFRPKYFLKQAFSFLPPKILWSKKVGFGTPIPDWFTGDFKFKIVDSVLNINSSYNIFNDFWLDNLVLRTDSSILAQKNKSIWQLWTVYVFLTWYDELYFQYRSCIK